jgi:arylsulfatase A-like enzyme
MSNSKKPNILYVVIDGFRTDKFYGPNKTSITPFLDSLIKKGIFFDQCVSSAPCTIPSIASTITSLYPFECIIQDENIFTLNPQSKTYISNLKKFGYTTYATYQDVIYFLGLDKIYDFSETYSVHSKLWNGLGKQIIEKLDNKMKEPWFYYLHLYDLHLLSFSKEHLLKNGPKEIHDKKFGVNPYERIITAIDPWLKKIIESVDLKNTIIVITSDHGSYTASYTKELEEFNYKNIESRTYNPSNLFKIAQNISKFIPPAVFIGKKKLAKIYISRTDSKIKKNVLPNLAKINQNVSTYTKRLMHASVTGESSVYDDLFRIPLLILGYNVPSNKIIHKQVRSVDIFPTLFDIAKLDEKPLGHGMNVMPLIHDLLFEELPAFLEAAYNSPRFGTTKIIGIRTSKFKYFREKYDEKSQVHLYDLENDPLEEKNIAKNNLKIIKKMEEILLQLKNDNGFDYKKSHQILNIDEEKKIEQELRKMGYM